MQLIYQEKNGKLDHIINNKIMEESIFNLMLKHHELLEELFTAFKKEVDNKTSNVRATYDRFVWEVKKHFFSEESAIFNLPQAKILKVWEILKQLKKEHIIMLDSLQRFSEKITNITVNEMDEFYSLMESHRKIEELNLYPKLDKGLSESQKSQVIINVTEIYNNKEVEY